MKVSIDVGYSQVKAIGENGKKVLFPSVRASTVNDPTAGMFSPGVGYRVKTRSFSGTIDAWVGEAAQQSLTATSTLGRRKSSELHDLFILTAAYLCGASGETQLAVGLPLAFYRSQKQELKSRLETLSAHVQIDNGPERLITICNTSVFPQGAGVLLSNGLNLAQEGKIGLIDIGYYTTDYLLFQVMEGAPYPVAELCGSLDSGVHLISRALTAAYEEKTGAIAPKFLLNDVMLNKPLYFNGQKLEMWDDILSIYEKTAFQVTQEIASIWGKEVDLINQTILAGGGSVLLGRYLDFPNKTIPADPVFANTEGFLGMMAGQVEAKAQ